MSVYLPALETGRRLRLGKAAAAAALLFLLLVLVPLIAIVGIQQQASSSLGGIPAKAQPFLDMYADAARVYRINPYLLMAIHEDETDYSTSTHPGVHTGLNTAGCCAGPMQFSITNAATPSAGGAGGTWNSYRNAYKKAHLTRPARYPGYATVATPNVYDSYDAIYAAASYLHDLGAGTQLDDHTLNALTHWTGTPPASLPYARRDLDRARELQTLAQTTLDPTTSPELGSVRGPPLQRLIAYATRIEGLQIPYCWGGGHATRPGPSFIVAGCWRASDLAAGRTFDATGLDCSGAVRWLLVLVGYPDPGGLRSDLLGARFPAGPGKHVTIWSNPDHIFLIIDGRGWGTSDINPGHGPGWAPHPTDGFQPSHPAGL